MLSRQDRSKEEKTIVRSMVVAIEDYCRGEHLDHRFVGGMSYGGLLNSDTTYAIDVTKRKITLKNHNPLRLLRSDKSVRDIDFILCSYAPEKVQPLNKFLNKLKWQVRLKLSYTPPISFEGLTQYGSKPPGLLKFVTTLQIQRGVVYLVFDKVSQAVSSKSLEPWTVVLDDNTAYTTRNPIADYYAYQFRSPAGVKPKDTDKVAHLKRLVDAMIIAGEKHKIDYTSEEYFAPWQQFIDEIQTSAIPSVKFNRMVTKLYWSTIGTTLAHGRGIGKPIFALFNFLTRHTQ